MARPDIKLSISRIVSILQTALLLTLAAQTALADTLEMFRSRQDKVKAVVKSAVATTVAITAEQQGGTGSGVIVSKDGLILTAAHVTAATGKKLTIIFSDGRKVPGIALGSNLTLDTGLARLTEEGPWPFSQMGQSDIIPMGTWCVALGHPGGFMQDRPPPVRIGRIWHRDQYGALYSDCTLIGGDSGGPLFDLNGQVIGIHSSIGGSLSTNRHAAVDSFREHWNRMLNGEVWGKLHLDPDAGDLATMGIELDWSSQNGALVRAVRTNAPAAAAGIRAGDLIVQFAGESITSSIQLLHKLGEMKAGDLASLTVHREDQVVDMELTLTDYKSLTEPPASGAEPVPDSPYLGINDLEQTEGGVQVGSVTDSSPAAAAGIQAADIISAVDDSIVTTPEMLVELLLRRTPDTSVTLSLMRGEETKIVTVKLGRQ
ncbi:MAG: PDZ domain-containing protein [Verrucomicrobiales bacterium]